MPHYGFPCLQNLTFSSNCFQFRQLIQYLADLIVFNSVINKTACSKSECGCQIGLSHGGWTTAIQSTSFRFCLQYSHSYTVPLASLKFASPLLLISASKMLMQVSRIMWYHTNTSEMHFGNFLEYPSKGINCRNREEREINQFLGNRQ